MKKLFYVIIGLPLTTLFAACNYFPDDVQTQLVSVTTCDTDVNFRTYNTFVISDSVGYLRMKKDTMYIEKKKNAETEFIVNSVVNKLEQYCGYVQQGSTQITPDLVVDLLYVDVVNTAVLYTDWWYYWDYWASYWFYPLHPYYPVAVTAYESGTLVIDMKDLKNAVVKPNGVSVKTVWTGAVRGLYTGTHTNEEINNALTDCFVQTPSISFKKTQY